MDTIIIKGTLLLPTGARRGAVTVHNGRIETVNAAGGAGRTYDFGDALVAPGFVDMHLHGLGPYGMLDTEDILGASVMQPQFGTTGFVPTAASLSAEEYVRFGRNVREAQAAAEPGAARILGAHFEGPFINPLRRGAMLAERLRPATAEECLLYLEEVGGAMRMMTLSPELPGAIDVIRLLRRHGVIASAGHSLATENEIEAAIGFGLDHVCHLFNTFVRPAEFGNGSWSLESATALLARRKLDCEVICDMRHVAAENVRMAAAALGPDRFIAITDSMVGAGLPPSDYETEDGRRFSTRDGAARLASDGTLAGSVITLDKAFANLVECCGVHPATAARYVSTNAAKALGILGEAGTLEAGKRANLTILDADYNCMATFVNGIPAHLR